VPGLFAKRRFLGVKCKFFCKAAIAANPTAAFAMNFLAAERRGIAGDLSESAAEADAQGLRGVLDPATKFL